MSTLKERFETLEEMDEMIFDRNVDFYQRVATAEKGLEEVVALTEELTGGELETLILNEEGDLESFE